MPINTNRVIEILILTKTHNLNNYFQYCLFFFYSLLNIAVINI